MVVPTFHIKNMDHPYLVHFLVRGPKQKFVGKKELLRIASDFVIATDPNIEGWPVNNYLHVVQDRKNFKYVNLTIFFYASRELTLFGRCYSNGWGDFRGEDAEYYYIHVIKVNGIVHPNTICTPKIGKELVESYNQHRSPFEREKKKNKKRLWEHFICT
jgi:hypothetical protein